MSEYRLVRSDDVLYHYGVKGMKWGHRKAQKYEAKAKTARESAKEWKEIGEHKAAKLASKGKLKKADAVRRKYEDKAKDDRADAFMYEKKAAVKKKEAAFQKKQAEVGASRSVGSKLATNILAGPFANRTYNSVLAAGGSRVGAAAVTACATILGGPIGHIAVASMYRADAGQNKTIRNF